MQSAYIRRLHPVKQTAIITATLSHDVNGEATIGLPVNCYIVAEVPCCDDPILYGAFV